FPALAKEVSVSGRSVTVFKDSKPYVVISPALEPEKSIGNKETIEAMQEAEKMMQHKTHPYSSNAAMYQDLGL
ncbi:MAG: hypothetical protein RR655_08140, partial [Raoultibacter sp.]